MNEYHRINSNQKKNKHKFYKLNFGLSFCITLMIGIITTLVVLIYVKINPLLGNFGKVLNNADDTISYINTVVRNDSTSVSTNLDHLTGLINNADNTLDFTNNNIKVLFPQLQLVINEIRELIKKLNNSY